MLEKITNTFSGIVRKISGKATITEKNIEEAVEEIKIPRSTPLYQLNNRRSEGRNRIKIG